MDSLKETCAICLGSMRTGQGQALFTAECSHIFHFNCIATNVGHGNHICPTCRCTWKHLPLQAPPTEISPPATRPVWRTRSFGVIPPPTLNITDPYSIPQRQPNIYVTSLFDDDEPLRSSTQSPDDGTSFSTTSPRGHAGNITIKALPEYPSLSRSEQSDSFAVLLGVHAPPLSPEASDRPGTRAPLDLVAVLDVSGSMSGYKIRLLKQAVNFVVDNLGPSDRLSVITFSTSARRVTPLMRMTDAGRENMTQAVNNLMADGATNIIAGLKLAVQVLQQRREKNPVSSIILLSDGQDNQNGHGSRFLHVLRELPACIRSRDNMDTSFNNNESEASVPVHTFGFGSDHDATALHAIADGSGGTFSYIESIEIIQDAFAQCIGGLLSVVAQEVEIHVNVISHGVRIQSIPSGRYRSRVDNNSGKNGVVYVEELYAEEEKNFLVYLSIAQEKDSETTQLLEVKCLYKDPLSNEGHTSEAKIVEIRRPSTEAMSESDEQICLEVDRERNRVYVAEGIAQAQAMAERGELQQAYSSLGQSREKLRSTTSAQLGDVLSVSLESELKEVQERMASRAEYEGSGRAFALSRKSAHMYQRATTQALLSHPKQQQHSMMMRQQPQSMMMQQQPQSMMMLQQQSAMPQSSVFTRQASSNPAVSGATSSSSSGVSPVEGTRYQTSFMRHMVTKSQQLRHSNLQDDKGTGGN